MQRIVIARLVATWAALLGLLAGCATSTSSTPQPPMVRGADLSGNGPGSLISATVITNIDHSVPLGTTAARIMYRSTSGVDGSATVVSGAVFIPPGRPPRGGWPIIAVAHGTSGFDPECGPSLFPDLMGNIGVVVRWLRYGFAVAAADYQGLGAPGVHPYLDAKTAGLNVIDSVRALRRVSREVSGRWAAIGGSQGGAAVWAANEQAARYAPELYLVGTVSKVPAADQSDLADDAAAGTLNNDQKAMYIAILRGLSRTHPGFPLDDYRRGVVQEKWDVLNACAGPLTEERARLIDRGEIAAADLTPASDGARQRLRDLLAQMALPQGPATAPMLVIYTGRDEFIPVEATQRSLERACALGDQIDVVFEPDKTHGEVGDANSFEWIGQRFSSIPASSNC
ncbi:hypothetical protein FK535_19325 [Mycolicibacterium sp. 018/SC-01/001]|uniref:lipase family protein n=1 Tax=Mycolicibacterium sp. 018/SC-01/001 TaxID=2592069 RepID=UPI00117EC31E|nr:lipase family protein [Mycolicibacterium sp. 018/SC-01/001]TRW80495.1 hypothetical protein FK535_19325 [Mycolicibacterium sp. 018/SC-01/001]